MVRTGGWLRKRHRQARNDREAEIGAKSAQEQAHELRGETSNDRPSCAESLPSQPSVCVGNASFRARQKACRIRLLQLVRGLCRHSSAFPSPSRGLPFLRKAGVGDKDGGPGATCRRGRLVQMRRGRRTGWGRICGRCDKAGRLLCAAWAALTCSTVMNLILDWPHSGVNGDSSRSRSRWLSAGCLGPRAAWRRVAAASGPARSVSGIGHPSQPRNHGSTTRAIALPDFLSSSALAAISMLIMKIQDFAVSMLSHAAKRDDRLFRDAVVIARNLLAVNLPASPANPWWYMHSFSLIQPLPSSICY